MKRLILYGIVLIVCIGILIWQRCPPHGAKTVNTPVIQGETMSPSAQEKSEVLGPSQDVQVQPEVPEIRTLHAPSPKGAKRHVKKPRPVALSKAEPSSVMPQRGLSFKIVRARLLGEEMRAYFLLLDGLGRPIRDMKAGEFSVREFVQGAASRVNEDNVRLLPSGAREPASIVLVLDYSDSMQGKTEDLESAVGHFIDVIGKDDRVLIMKFADQIAVVTERFIADKRALKKSLQKHPEIRYSTSLYMAIDMAVLQVLQEDQPRVVVAFTDGDDTSSPPEFNPRQIIRKARKADVQIFTIGLGEEVIVEDLKKIADGTQGVFSYAPESKDLYDVYSRIASIISKTPILVWPTLSRIPSFEITYTRGDASTSARYPQP